jgi:hypothetical protein
MTMEDQTLQEGTLQGLAAVLGIARDDAQAILDKYKAPLAQYQALAAQGDKVAAEDVQDLLTQIKLDLAGDGVDLQAAGEAKLQGWLLTSLSFAKVLLL